MTKSRERMCSRLPIESTQRAELSDDLRTVGFKPIREVQTLAECRHRLINRESRGIAGNLHQQTIGGSEVDALEVGSVANLGDIDFLLEQMFAPGAHLFLVVGAEGDMVGLPNPFPRLAAILRRAEERHITARQDPLTV